MRDEDDARAVNTGNYGRPQEGSYGYRLVKSDPYDTDEDAHCDEDVHYGYDRAVKSEDDFY